MNNKNTGLKVFVILLSVLVVVLGGYIVYDKALNNVTNIENSENFEDDNNSDMENNNSNNNENNVTENVTEEKIKEIFEFAYNYYELPSVYCGKTDNELVQIYGEERKASTEFSTYDEMLDLLKKYMTTEVIAGKYAFAATTKEYYLEKDGKLYCTETNKGYMYDHGNIDIETTSKHENKISCVATMELTDPSGNKTYDKVNIVLEKNNDNWIITSYEK